MDILAAGVDGLQVGVDLSPWILLHDVPSLELSIAIVAIELVVARLGILLALSGVTSLHSLIRTIVYVLLLLDAGWQSSLVRHVRLHFLLARESAWHLENVTCVAHNVVRLLVLSMETS